MEIVEDFDEISYNNNGSPWKSSKILHVNPMFFIFLSFFIIFPFSFFFHFHFLANRGMDREETHRNYGEALLR